MLLHFLLSAFSNSNSLGQSASSCFDQCHSIGEAIQHCTSESFSGIHNFFPIKSDVSKLDTVQKAYSVNKGLFLGVFSLP